MTRLRPLIAAALLVCALTGAPLRAQDAGDGPTPPAILVADALQVEAGDRLIASGNVEVLQDETRMTASRVIYDDSDGSLIVEGPIRIAGPRGEILLADSAELDRELRDGLLTGARLVLDQQLQLAAAQGRRVDGRYTQLSRVVATSCRICGDDGVPLWQIRARQVIHDEEARQLYFENAQFRVAGVPIFWAPRLRLPDPTVERARGFLIPTLSSSSLLGLGVKTPYFIPIGDHQDVTLTPYLSPETTTLEFRYRRAFANGDLQVLGAVSRDSLQPDARGYLFADGRFDLRRDYTLEFQLRTVSDPSYLSDYDYDGADRLDSAISLTRARRDEFVGLRFVHYESLRAGEDYDTQPALVADLRTERRFFPAALGGELRLGGVAHGHYRYSSDPFDGPDDDTLSDGRDVARLGVDLSWRDRWTLPGGLRAGITAQLWIDRFSTTDDVAVAADATSVTPAAAIELRWPLLRQGPAGGRTLLEPVLQAGWVGEDRPNVANDESTRPEFDEGNLLSLSRFAAADRRARGQSLAGGLRLLHQAPGGWQVGSTVARVWQAEPSTDFTRSSGLDSGLSDWLVATHFEPPDGLRLTARGLLDESIQFSKAEASLGWEGDRLSLDATYLLLVTDPEEERDKAQSEWTLAGSYDIDRHWQTSARARYDLSGQRLDRLGLGLRYRNECIDVGFSASRRYARSANIAPSTNFDLTVALNGFGTGGSGKEFRRTCTQ